MAAQLTDKDGVFALLSHGEFRFLQAQELARPCYRPVSSSSLAQRLRELGFDRWAYEATRWLQLRGKLRENFLRRWSCIVNTHKKTGYAVARSAHSSVNHMNNAISAVLVRLLDPELRRLPHIACCSEDVQRHVLAATVSPRTVLLKFDVKEFYLSGDHNKLA